MVWLNVSAKWPEEAFITACTDILSESIVNPLNLAMPQVERRVIVNMKWPHGYFSGRREKEKPKSLEEGFHSFHAWLMLVDRVSNERWGKALSVMKREGSCQEGGVQTWTVGKCRVVTEEMRRTRRPAWGMWYVIQLSIESQMPHLWEIEGDEVETFPGKRNSFFHRFLRKDEWHYFSISE